MTADVSFLDLAVPGTLRGDLRGMRSEREEREDTEEATERRDEGDFFVASCCRT